MHAYALNCTLKPGPEPSSTDALLDQIEAEFAALGVDLTRDRLADFDVPPGVVSKTGDGDRWPTILERILEADIFILGTPIWLGHPSSLAQRALERLDAMISETDERGQMRIANRVALVAVVGNEDGAHHVGAELFQGLNDVGFTVPANGMTYWVGEAMGRVDYLDLPSPPEKTASTTRAMAINAAHLANLLAGSPYPAFGG